MTLGMRTSLLFPLIFSRYEPRDSVGVVWGESEYDEDTLAAPMLNACLVRMQALSTTTTLHLLCLQSEIFLPPLLY
jgi:hypothetical protein